MVQRDHIVRMAGIFLILSMMAPLSIRGQCREYELLVRDGLKKGQSLSIRVFSVNELAPYHYRPEPLEAVQEALATELQKSLAGVDRFTGLTLIRGPESPPTDLVLEGTISRIDEGSRKRRILLADDKSAAKMRVSAVFKRVSSGETVMWFHCTDSQLGGLLGMGGLFTEGGKTLVHRCARRISKDISGTILKADKEPIRGKPVSRW